jgi:hypothetical protein
MEAMAGRTGKLAGLVILGGLLAASAAQAQTRTCARIYGQVPCCERRAYCPLNYMMPITYGLRAFCHGPTRYTFSKDYFRGIPITLHPIYYRCRAIDPRVYSLDHYYPGVRMPVDVGPPPPSDSPQLPGGAPFTPARQEDELLRDPEAVGNPATPARQEEELPPPRPPRGPQEKAPGADRPQAEEAEPGDNAVSENTLSLSAEDGPPVLPPSGTERDNHEPTRQPNR